MSKRLSKRKQRQVNRDINYVVDTKFRMEPVQPITENQARLMNAYNSGKNIMALGTAGTGKTYISLFLALKDVLNKGEYSKVIIIRSAVQARDQGFMPGTLTEKMSYYETPYIDITNSLFERADAYSILKRKDNIQFMSSSFVRGLTFDNAIIIVDECQNFGYTELSAIVTRVGENSRIIFCGDTKQDELIKNKYDKSGLIEFVKVLDTMDSFSRITFTVDDVVRSGVVREFILAEEALCA